MEDSKDLGGGAAWLSVSHLLAVACEVVLTCHFCCIGVWCGCCGWWMAVVGSGCHW